MLEKYTNQATEYCPMISLDHENGMIELKGKSIPANTDFLYLPVLEWMDAYIRQPQQMTIANFSFEYFNTLRR